ncbi:MAG: hypothetical protein WD011_00985 [Nitriliruptoraceae bacterium]
MAHLTFVRRLATAALLAALVGACATTPEPAPAPEAPPAGDDAPVDEDPETPEPPQPDSDDAADEPADEEPADEPTEVPDERIAVVDVRVAEHDGYDRVVFELSGTAEAWNVEYGEALGQGSGEPVEVAGAATLRVSVDGVGYPADLPAGVTPWTNDPLAGPGTSIVEVVHDAIFEGRHTFFVGTEGELPYFTSVLEDPHRIIIDVVHPMS